MKKAMNITPKMLVAGLNLLDQEAKSTRLSAVNGAVVAENAVLSRPKSAAVSARKTQTPFSRRAAARASPKVGGGS